MSTRKAAMPAAARGSTPRAIVAAFEAEAEAEAEAKAEDEAEAATTLPSADDERLAGSGVMGLPFSSGRYLALRRFPASSVGPAFSAVWWRDPQNHWTMFTSVAAELSCPRYFGRALEAHELRDIELTWSGPYTLRVIIAEVLDWDMTLGSNVATRMMSSIGVAMPSALWRNPVSLGLIGRTAPLMLRVGRINLQGTVTNGQWFQANPRRLWLVEKSHAMLRGKDLGAPAPLPKQTRLGDVWLPQRCMFFVGEAYMERQTEAP